MALHGRAVVAFAMAHFPSRTRIAPWRCIAGRFAERAEAAERERETESANR